MVLAIQWDGSSVLQERLSIRIVVVNSMCLVVLGIVIQVALSMRPLFSLE